MDPIRQQMVALLPGWNNNFRAMLGNPELVETTFREIGEGYLWTLDEVTRSLKLRSPNTTTVEVIYLEDLLKINNADQLIEPGRTLRETIIRRTEAIGRRRQEEKKEIAAFLAELEAEESSPGYRSSGY